MRLLCLIDTLDSGGAQRQLCTLACMLKKRGWDVSVLAYHPGDFFLPMLRDADVGYLCLPPYPHWRRTLAIRRILRRGDQNVVLAFLDGPVLYAELATIPWRRWGLVVSERNAVPWVNSSQLNRLRRFHCLADYVTTNSHANRAMIEYAVPALKDRLVTIYNTVNFTDFSLLCPPPNDSNDAHFVVAARYESQKNPEGLIRAIGIVKKSNPSARITLDWYGRHPSENDSVLRRAQQLVRNLGLSDCVHLHGETRAIKAAYELADAVVMPSFFEGLSNTVCEAMVCGRPVLSSNVCDAGNLVQDGLNGFLFDPLSAEAIAQSIRKFLALSKSERKVMGLKSRERADRIFDSEVVVSRYQQVLTAAARRAMVPVAHWVPEVPDAVYDFRRAPDPG